MGQFFDVSSGAQASVLDSFDLGGCVLSDRAEATIHAESWRAAIQTVAQQHGMHAALVWHLWVCCRIVGSVPKCT